MDDNTLFQIKINDKYICKYPNFITHASDAEPCTNLVACDDLIYTDTGRVVRDYFTITDFDQVDCLCKSFEISKKTSQGYPACQQARAIDVSNQKKCIGFPHNPITGECLCPKNRISTKDEDALLKAGYKNTVAFSLSQLPETCVMKPCAFDPTDGRFLEGASWNGTSCICPKEYSITGVFVNEAGNGNAVNVAKESDGYNACVRINSDRAPANADNLVYVSQFIPPEGVTRVWFEPWDYRKELFPTLESRLAQLENAKLFVKSRFDPNNPNLVTEGLFDRALPLDPYYDYLVTNPYIPESEQKLIVEMKKDDYADLPGSFPFKDGTKIRNPVSLHQRSEDTSIIKYLRPLMVVEDKTISIYDHLLMNSENDLVNLPRKKQKKEEESSPRKKQKKE